MPSERQYRREMVVFGQMLHQRGYVAATDGNLSARLDDDRIVVTPTGMSKSMLRASDMVVVDLEGRRLAGNRNVSSELAMHLLIYRLRPDVQGIVHAHPPTATGFAAAGLPLNQPLVSEVVMGLGSIPLAKYGTPGTPELSETLKPLVPYFNAILMSNHGAVTHVLGRQQPLGEQELQKLVEARVRYSAAQSVGLLPLTLPGNRNHNGRSH